MEPVYKKIERYLKREFPGRQIIRGNENSTLAGAITEYYGTGGMLILISDDGEKIYYQFNKRK